jgi:hypothetical protein
VLQWVTAKVFASDALNPVALYSQAHIFFGYY